MDTPGLIKTPTAAGVRRLVVPWVALLLLACGGGGDSDPTAQVLLHRSDFRSGERSPWLTFDLRAPGGCTALDLLREADGNGYGTSSAPWWIDPNHAHPGMGYLHLVAFAYHKDWSVDGLIAPPLAGRPIDLRDGEMLVRWRAPTLELPADTRLLFWFQTRDPSSGPTLPRYVNYVLTGQPLVPRPGGDTGWIETRLRLSSAAGQFECLASNAPRGDTYTCAPSVTEALRSWAINLGFVLLFPNADSAVQIAGGVEFDDIALSIPRSNLGTHADAPATYVGGASTYLSAP